MSFWNDPLKVVADWLLGILTGWGLSETLALIIIGFLGVFVLIALLGLAVLTSGVLILLPLAVVKGEGREGVVPDPGTDSIDPGTSFRNSSIRSPVTMRMSALLTKAFVSTTVASRELGQGAALTLARGVGLHQDL